MIGCLKTIVNRVAKKRFITAYICFVLPTAFPCFGLYAQNDAAAAGDTLQESGMMPALRRAGQEAVRELKNIIIVPPKEASAADTFNIQTPIGDYFGTEGRIIERIRIVQIKPFGVADIEDTVPEKLSWPARTGNAVHVNTREFIIRNMLLFREGERVVMFRVADSERILRELRYIDDARIRVVPLGNDRAEIVVLVRDVFPYAASFGTNFSSTANFSVTNRNILGTGVEVKMGMFIDSRKEPRTGYEAAARIQNIGRTFITFQADYLDRFENRRAGFVFRRDFHAPTTRYAGHLSFYDTGAPVSFYRSRAFSDDAGPILVRYRHGDVWLGRSFQINKNPFNKQRNNITASLGAQQIYFIDRPANAQDLYYRFQNRTTFLSSLTYSQQAYYKSNMIYNFGRTEDIPYGLSVSAVAGKEFNEIYDRPYIGASLSAGYFVPKVGYLSGRTAYGTFFRDGTEQGSVSAELNYFTTLQVIGRFRQRIFVDAQYTRQLDTRLNDYLVIDDDYGIPGFGNDSIVGRHRFNLAVEQTLFTPWNRAGFRFVVYAFANFSWIGEYDETIPESTLYSSFGVGVRIRNNRLVFNTLQIQFAYFPGIPSHSRFRYIQLSRETILEPRNFMPKAPATELLY